MKPGRKPLPPESRRSYTLAVSMTPAERARIEAAAAMLGQPVAEYLRESALVRASVL